MCKLYKWSGDSRKACQQSSRDNAGSERGQRIADTSVTNPAKLYFRNTSFNSGRTRCAFKTIVFRSRSSRSKALTCRSHRTSLSSQRYTFGWCGPAVRPVHRRDLLHEAFNLKSTRRRTPQRTPACMENEQNLYACGSGIKTFSTASQVARNKRAYIFAHLPWVFRESFVGLDQFASDSRTNLGRVV